jgi:hypothetical protein
VAAGADAPIAEAQCLHLTATARTSSPQYGHGLVSPMGSLHASNLAGMVRFDIAAAPRAPSQHQPAWRDADHSSRVAPGVL